MADFASDRDYSLSYSDGSNKSLYARNAISAFNTSAGGRFEKRVFITILENYRLFTQCGITSTVYGDVISVKMKSRHLYDLAYMVHQAFLNLESVENWDLQAKYDTEQDKAILEGIAFVHPLRDVQDAFGFRTGEMYRDWFRVNRPLLNLFKKLEVDGDHHIPGGRFSVDEDFVVRWEQAIQPERISQADMGSYGWWRFQSGEGWVLEDD